VDDRATAALMKYFYQSMLHDGQPPAAALRLAKQRVRQEDGWNSPYFWAGFVLYGEYNQRIVVEDDTGRRNIVRTAFVLFAISLGGVILRRRRRRLHLLGQSPSVNFTKKS
jgi:hypothetical protein